MYNYVGTDICPWHSWIARQTPTLKAEGSNPFGQAKTNPMGRAPLGLFSFVSNDEEPLAVA